MLPGELFFFLIGLVDDHLLTRWQFTDSMEELNSGPLNTKPSSNREERLLHYKWDQPHNHENYRMDIKHS